MKGDARSFDTDERRSDRLVLPAIDLAVVAGLILVGQVMHARNPLVDPLGALESVVPFVLGWLAIAVLVGLYAGESDRTPLRVARETTVCWIAAANVGFLLRGSPLFAGGVPWAFTVVLTGLGLVVLVAWRVGSTALRGRRFDSAA